MLSGMQKPKRPRDRNQLGKLIVHLSVGEANDSENMPDDSGKDAGKTPQQWHWGRKAGRLELRSYQPSRDQLSRKRLLRPAGQKIVDRYHW